MTRHPVSPSLSRRGMLLAAAATGGLSLLPRGFVWAQKGTGSDKQLIIRTESPLNGEPDLAELIISRITPVSHFYVRNHGNMPKIEESEYRLVVEGMVGKKLSLSLAELREKFKQHSAEATLTCAGNRREEMSAIKPISGVQWSAGAIGNATWQGATLAEILRAAEIREGAKHVWFEGLDEIKEKDGSVAPFGGSIPLDKALAAKSGDAPSLLATTMNDQPLTREHGAPLRMVVPGYIGARSVKWLGKIVVSDRPSPNHYLAEAYKIVTTTDKAELAAADPIYAFPINAAICAPASGAKLKAGKITVSGYALPFGDPGCSIKKVELSLDGGRTWKEAKLAGDAKPFLWRLWSLDVELSPAVKSLIVRATDSSGKTQPEKTPWNMKGYMQNAWHQVKVEVA